LPEITINKAINDLRKRLNACISADGHFEHITWTRQRQSRLTSCITSSKLDIME